MSIPYYPGSLYTPVLGLSLFGMDEVLAENMVILDAAYGAGSSIFVNGTLVESPNLNGTLPAAPTGYNNVIFQYDSNGNVSAYASTSGGSSIQVNGSTVSNPNFNGTTPAALTNTVNVQFQVSGSSVSGYVPALVPNKTLYVDNTRTDSFTPNGTIAFPFATITAAINQVIANGDNATYTYLIDIQPSVYAETINIGNASLYNLMFEGHGGAAAAYASSGTPMPGAIVHPASGNALQGTTNVDQIKILQFSGLTFLGPVNITDTVSNNLGANGFAFVNCCFGGNVTISAATGYVPLQFVSSAIGFGLTVAFTYCAINWITSDMNWGTMNLANTFMEVASWALNPQNLNINAGSSVTVQDGVNVGAQTVTVASGGRLTLINAIVIANLVINSGGVVTNYLGAIEGTITNNGTYTIAGTATNFSADIMNAGTGFRINSAAASGHYLRGNGTNYLDGTIQAADVPTLNQNTTGTAANLSGTPALPNGTTATTQVATDATTLIATDAFVQNAIDAAAPLLGIPWFNLIDALDYNQVVPWYNNGSPFAIDTGISRISAGVLGVGTGAQGSIAGSLSLANATHTSVNATPGTASSTAGFVLLQNTTPTVTGASTTVAIKTATAPINVSGNTWRYTFAVTESGAGSNAWVGASVTISGYTTTATGNNGTFVIIASTTTTFDVVNATGTTADGGTPVVISSAVVNSPILQIAGTVNTGTAGTLNSVADVWSIQNVLGSVVPNPISTLTFTHSGSSGTAIVSVPSLALVGNIYYSSELALFSGTPTSNTLEFVMQAATFRGSNLATIGFSPGTPSGAAADTAISRVSAGIVAVGTGAQGSIAGSIQCSSIALNGAVASPTAGVYYSGGTAGVSAGPFSAITSIQTIGGIVTVLADVSDERLKDHTPYIGGLKEILSITPIKYTWNTEGQKITGFSEDRIFVGFRAQDVQKAIPEAVTQSASNAEYLGLDDRPIVAAMINAFKEQQAQFKQQQAQIEELKEVVRKLAGQ